MGRVLVNPALSLWMCAMTLHSLTNCQTEQPAAPIGISKSYNTNVDASNDSIRGRISTLKKPPVTRHRRKVILIFAMLSTSFPLLSRNPRMAGLLCKIGGKHKNVKLKQGLHRPDCPAESLKFPGHWLFP